jgi:aromatic-L-amino-acid decarboxylase
MNSDDFRRYGHRAIEWIADYLDHAERYSVVSPVRPGDLTDALPASGPERGESMDDILSDFDRFIVPSMTHWNHPGFMAWFANSSPPEGILGELLCAALNGNGMLWKSAPAITELEQVVLSWLREWCGLPASWFGMIHDTASTGVMHAVAAARQAADPEVRTRGAFHGLTVYVSEQAHTCTEKGAISLGMGQDNVRRIAVDSQFRMIPEALEEAVQQDLASGLRPCLVTATVGTTGTTSVDPVPAIADIAARHRIWLHIDAAYAGSAAVAEEFRWALEGCERADSFIMNPHKWLLTPMDSSIFYTSRPEVLRQAFSLVPDILYTTADPRAVNLMDYGVPLGRRFRALKLWFVLRSYGHEGVAAMIREHVRLARCFAAKVEADPRFEIAAPAPFSTVCFRYCGTDDENRAILEAVNRSGEIFLSGTQIAGRYILRLAVGNRATADRHIDRAWDLIRNSISHPSDPSS